MFFAAHRIAFAVICYGLGCITMAWAGNTALVFDSRGGGPAVNAGLNSYYTSADGTFTAERYGANGVAITSTAEPGWEFNFVAPGDKPLIPGTYTGVGSLEPVATHPGLEVVYGGTSESSAYGTFVVKEVVYGSGDQVLAFDATFTYGLPTTLPVQGEIMFNASGPLPPRVRILSSLVSYATEGQPFRYWIWASGTRQSYTELDPPTTNTYAADNLPPGLSIDTRTGWITGTPTRRGSYSITIRSANALGSASAILRMIVDPPWRSTGPYTALLLRDDAWEYFGDGKTAFFTPLEGVLRTWRFSQTDPALYAGFANNTSRGPYVDWQFKFAAPHDGPLIPGSYPNAVSGRGPNTPYALLEVAGNGRGNGSTGNFVVRENSVDTSGAHFSVSLNCYTNSAPVPLKAKFWFQARKAITSYLLSTGSENHPYSYQVVANNNPQSFTASGLPRGLSINTTTGLISGTPQQAGVFQVTLTARGPSTVASDQLQLMLLPAEHLANISTRGLVWPNNQVLIGGFIITDSFNLPEPKKIMIRAIGPSLSRAGLTGVLQDPTVELHDMYGDIIARNNNWKTTIIGGLLTANQRSEIQNSGLAPTDDSESAMIVMLGAGAYTTVVRGANSALGLGLVEIYELNQDSLPRLANISTRGLVQVGNNILIGGFIIVGANGTGGKVLIRALGPSVPLSGVLPDPVLELYNANGAIMASNDNWQDSQQAAIAATGIPPPNPKESAILATLLPGSYTVVVHGRNSSTGAGLVEIYNLK